MVEMFPTLCVYLQYLCSRGLYYEVRSICPGYLCGSWLSLTLKTAFTLDRCHAGGCQLALSTQVLPLVELRVHSHKSGGVRNRWPITINPIQEPPISMDFFTVHWCCFTLPWREPMAETRQRFFLFLIPTLLPSLQMCQFMLTLSPPRAAWMQKFTFNLHWAC